MPERCYQTVYTKHWLNDDEGVMRHADKNSRCLEKVLPAARVGRHTDFRSGTIGYLARPFAR